MLLTPTIACLQVPAKSAARLVRSLLRIGAPDCQLFPDSSAIPVIAPLAAPGTAEDPGRPQCVWQLPALPNYVHYHARQFVSALLVLVRYLACTTRVTVDKADRIRIKQLHYDLQVVSGGWPSEGVGWTCCGATLSGC